jgi:hypothetical protein
MTLRSIVDHDFGNREALADGVDDRTEDRYRIVAFPAALR